MPLLLLVLLMFLLAACAAGPNPAVDTAAAESAEIAGFWLGLWHGIIAPIAFIVSLFNDGVNIYEVHNSGGWYNFGFLFGFSLLPGGGSGARRVRRT